MSGEDFNFSQEQDRKEQNQGIGAEALAQMPEFGEHMEELKEEKLNSTNELATEINDHGESLNGAEIYKKYEEELKGVDYDIQLALSQQEDMLKHISGGEEILREIKLSIARGEYRDAYMSKRTGKILFGDEADRAMDIELNDWHSDRFDRDGFNEFDEGEKKDAYRKAIDKKAMDFITFIPYAAYACTYAYGDAITGGSIAGGNPMMDLSNRIRRNLADGFYIGAKIDEFQEGTIVSPGVTWPRKAVAAQQAKYSLFLGDDLRADEHFLDAYNEERAWLRENKPDVMDSLETLAENIISVAGNEREAGHAIGIIDGCIRDGMYRDAYIDKRGYICKDNPEELLDTEYNAEDTAYKSSRDAVLEAYRKNSDSLTIDDIRAIAESPLQDKYINKKGIDVDFVLQKAATDKKLVIEYLLEPLNGKYNFLSYGEGSRLAKEDIKNNLSEYLSECLEHKINVGEHDPWQADVAALDEDEKDRLRGLIIYSGDIPFDAEPDSEEMRDYDRRKQIFAKHGLKIEDYRW